jgi:DNA-binding CsgD family transcriptional regulator
LVQNDAPGQTRLERLLLAHVAFRSARSGERTSREVATLARRALADGALLNDSDKDMGPYGAACYALLFAGEADTTIADLSRAIESTQRRGPPVAFGWFSLVRGIARYTRGDLVDAVADLQSADEAYREGYVHGLPAARAFLALCMIERNDLVRAADALALPGDENLWQTRPRCISYLYALGRLRAAQGQLREGFETLLECDHRLRDIDAPNPAANLSWRSEAALLAAQLGDRDRALDLVSTDLMLARRFGAPQALGTALRAAGLVEGTGAILKRLAEAVAVLDGSGINLELARSLTEYGAALRRDGARREAQTQLRRGLDLATRCGSLACAARARGELIAAGARPRRERAWGPDALTASELRVARMAASGMTNKEIAQSLFVTLRTVETHLTSIYRKLGAASREHLAGALGPEPALR